MEPITIYSAGWCPDCRRVKNFLKDRGVEFREVDIDVNNGKRKIPTLKVGERFFACSPFRASQLAEELNIPLNK
jgi:glutaredoxin